jgi:V/A-type H+-transporting ATPase subunit B
MKAPALGSSDPLKEYRTVTKIAGPLLFLEKTGPVGYGELVRIAVDGTRGGVIKLGQVLDTSEDIVVVQVFESTTGIDRGAHVKFLGKIVTLDTSPEIIGRVFNGRGQPIDDSPPLIPERSVPINGRPINPSARAPPSQFIQTGISAIDMTNTLVRGQKLPVFSAAGLPHNELALQITRQASAGGERFAVVFAGIGITNEEAHAFIKDLEETGAIAHSVIFLNKASDPTIERLLTPRMALTAAEYLAFDQGMEVLVIMTDMTNYCEALREIGAARQEIPGRHGYPGYMYTDLASLYERAGMIKGRKGSITQLPILTMIGDDITHPIPVLTGYITEGQILLSRELHNKGVYPPIDVLPSLSRLMNSGIGKGKTRDDHRQVADQLFASYAEGRDLRNLVAIIGEDALDQHQRRALRFAERFEREFLQQGDHENHPLIETMDAAWRLLGLFDRDELQRIHEEQKDLHYAPEKAEKTKTEKTLGETGGGQ